jgi:hypothetical protein
VTVPTPASPLTARIERIRSEVHALARGVRDAAVRTPYDAELEVGILAALFDRLAVLDGMGVFQNATSDIGARMPTSKLIRDKVNAGQCFICPRPMAPGSVLCEECNQLTESHLRTKWETDAKAKAAAATAAPVPVEPADEEDA